MNSMNFGPQFLPLKSHKNICISIYFMYLDILLSKISDVLDVGLKIILFYLYKTEYMFFFFNN